MSVLDIEGKYIFKLNNFELGSIHSIKEFKRAESLGLDLTKEENFLKKLMPTTDKVINTIYKKWEENDKNKQ